MNTQTNAAQTHGSFKDGLDDGLGHLKMATLLNSWRKERKFLSSMYHADTSLQTRAGGEKERRTQKITSVVATNSSESGCIGSVEKPLRAFGYAGLRKGGRIMVLLSATKCVVRAVRVRRAACKDAFPGSKLQRSMLQLV